MRFPLRTGVAVGLVLALAACGSPKREEGSKSSESAVVQAPGVDAPVPFRRCMSCHSVQPGHNGIGPSLAGVFGRKAGTLEGYYYTDAMKASGLTWDRPTLDKWLTHPVGLVPQTKMVFAGINDPAARKQVIDYLEGLK